MKFYALVALLLVGCSTVKKPIQESAIEAIVENESPPVSEFYKCSERTSGFCTDSNLSWMIEVVRVSNCVYGKEAFLEKIKNYPKFTHTSDTPAQVYEKLKTLPLAKIETYRSLFPSSATAYTQNSVIRYNTRNNPRGLVKMVRTATHEMTHVVGYSHGDNYPGGKENSVGYAVGTLSEEFVSACK